MFGKESLDLLGAGKCNLEGTLTALKSRGVDDTAMDDTDVGVDSGFVSIQLHVPTQTRHIAVSDMSMHTWNV